MAYSYSKSIKLSVTRLPNTCRLSLDPSRKPREVKRAKKVRNDFFLCFI